MNLKMLKALVGCRLRLLPTPVRWQQAAYEAVDDNWMVTNVGEDRTMMLVNERTKHLVKLATDHIHGYTSNLPDDNSFDGFLELKVKIDITDSSPKIDVILSGAARTFEQPKPPPLRTRIVELLRAINPEILSLFDGGAHEVAVMISQHNLRLLLALQKEDGFSSILSLRPTGSVSIGSGSRIGGHLNDRDQSGACQGYALRLTL